MRRSWIIAIVIALVLVVALGTGTALVLPGLRARPEPVASAYLAAWARADYPAMLGLVSMAPDDFAEQYERVRADLKVQRARFTLGELRTEGGARATAPFTAILSLRGIGNWSYQGQLQLSKPGRFGRDWRIDWSPAAIHPQLQEGLRFERTREWPERGSILAADGSLLAGPGGASGGPASLGSLVGSVREKATADDLKRLHLGAPYQPGDSVGRGGLEQTFERRLAGSPTGQVKLVDEDGNEVQVLRSFGGKPGAPVRTTIETRMQLAAESALGDAGGHYAALVAVQPSTGAIRAMVNLPTNGYQRATRGLYPPGSTFKVITTAALLQKGVRPSDKVTCPKDVKVGGVTIGNFEQEQLGTIPFNVAFAKSCNTAFVQLATSRLTGSELARAASRFGFGVAIAPGIRAETSRVPVPQSPAELAMSAFGQAKVTASPLQMAAVAAAVDSGTWRAPKLLDDQTLGTLDTRQPAPRPLDPAVADTLRSLMREVVTSGTAASAGLPDGVAGKTGTAEFGTGDNQPTHAWFIGFRGDLAVAVVVEGGGVGGEVAAPIAARFFRAAIGA
ncbi:MAG TPA: penicillin-binding transpeptidase domain-containing protein [Actinomycetes bacterium]|nr:penicillin-binding transpeptidase domain-containing protein [Actinomycetes bacterium]